MDNQSVVEFLKGKLTILKQEFDDFKHDSYLNGDCTKSAEKQFKTEVAAIEMTIALLSKKLF